MLVGAEGGVWMSDRLPANEKDYAKLGKAEFSRKMFLMSCPVRSNPVPARNKLKRKGPTRLTDGGALAGE